MSFSTFIKDNFYVPLIHAFDRWEDSKRCVSTHKNYNLRDLDVSSLDGNKYQPISYMRLKSILIIAKKLNPNSKFIALGCGLGRPLLVAEEFGFNDLLGLDISNKLLEKCKKNFSSRPVKPELVCSDVTNYTLPIGCLTIFLFNPFGRERIVNLMSKLQNSSRNGVIIYFNPKYKDEIRYKVKILELKWRNLGLFEETCLFYRF